MKKGIAIVVLFLFASCGGSQSFLSSPPPDKRPPLDDASGSPPNTSKSDKSFLDEFVETIHSENYDGSLIVEINDWDQPVKVEGNRLTSNGGAADLAVRQVNNVLDRVGGTVVEGLFGSDPGLLLNQKRQYEKLSSKRMRNPASFFRLTVTDRARAEALLRGLWNMAAVRSVIPVTKLIPLGHTTVPDLSGGQGYLRSFEESGGMNAEACWADDVRGEGVKILHLESGWNISHIELAEQGLPFEGGGDADNFAHGTAVLGLVAGSHQDNIGILGVAPGAQLRVGIGGPFGVAGAIDLLEPGDIILLTNSFTYGLPHDTFAASFSGIERAVAEGISVVSGVSNSGFNLDEDWHYDRVDSDGNPLVDVRVEDSGAIHVGAVESGTRVRASWSSCGSLVDLHAWGTGLVTPSYPGSQWTWFGTPPFDNNPDYRDEYYTNAFGGNSASTPIIAGAAAILQSHAKRAMGGRKYVTPEKIREILVDSGMPPANDGGCPVGVQPRLDVAVDLFDDFWTELAADFPELVSGETISGERRRALRDRGVGLICKLYDWEDSDVSCPETATCVLLPEGEMCEAGEEGCRRVRNLLLDVDRSDYDCIAGAIHPAGLRQGKALDFDMDLKADLVSWSESADRSTMNWKIDLSGNELGAWNLDFTVSNTGGRWVWPVVEDYNRDGRTDIAVYDKENGRWHIKFTNRALLNGEWDGRWDRVVEHPYRDTRSVDVWASQYARPVPGDYNQDGYIDLAIARSDGIWSIDHGGPVYGYHDGTFNEDIPYLDETTQLAEAPGWAYLPISNFMSGIAYKVPDGISNEGEVFVYYSDNYQDNIFLDGTRPYGGNESIPLSIYREGANFGIRGTNGSWLVADQGNEYALESVEPASIYGGLDCHPFVADFDGDGNDDRAVQCPTEFRIGLSSTGTALTIPLGYNRSQFSLPGKPYFGSISYAATQQLIDWQLRSRPTMPPIIPVDMVSTAFCRLAFAPGETPEECR